MELLVQAANGLEYLEDEQAAIGLELVTEDDPQSAGVEEVPDCGKVPLHIAEQQEVYSCFRSGSEGRV